LIILDSVATFEYEDTASIRNKENTMEHYILKTLITIMQVYARKNVCCSFGVI